MQLEGDRMTTVINRINPAHGSSAAFSRSRRA